MSFYLSYLLYINVLKNNFYLGVLYVCVCFCTGTQKNPWSPEEGVQFPGAGVPGDCELLLMWVLGAKIGSLIN